MWWQAFLPWARGAMCLKLLSLPMFWWHPANLEDSGGSKEKRMFEFVYLLADCCDESFSHQPILNLVEI
jgi:hypothetical protein